VRVATTKHGKKLHLLDPNTPDGKDKRTTCGRSRIKWTVIQKPVRGQVCQVCVKSAIAKMTRFLGIPVNLTVKEKIRPRGLPSQIGPKSLQAKGPPLTEGKTKHARKPRKP